MSSRTMPKTLSTLVALILTPVFVRVSATERPDLRPVWQTDTGG